MVGLPFASDFSASERIGEPLLVMPERRDAFTRTVAPSSKMDPARLGALSFGNTIVRFRAAHFVLALFEPEQTHQREPTVFPRNLFVAGRAPFVDFRDVSRAGLL